MSKPKLHHDSEKIITSISRWMRNAIECSTPLNQALKSPSIAPHRHPSKDETIVILEGRAKVFFYNSRGNMDGYVVLDRYGAHYGVNIPKNTWHTITCDEPCVLFECKEGPYLTHEEEGILKKVEG